jgi:hypothetical protein
MHAACTHCGRAFCKTHIVSRIGRCFRCAERCTHHPCRLIATKTCQRCRRSLCVNHRTRNDARCRHCENEFEERLAAERRPRELADPKHLLEAGVILAILVVSGIWLRPEYSEWMLVGGILVSMLGQTLGAEPKSQRGKARARFLSETRTE